MSWWSTPAKVHVTGNEADQSVFYYHPGYAGGSRDDRSASDWDPATRACPRKAVERMITRGPLQRKQMEHLQIYGGDAIRTTASNQGSSTSPRSTPGQEGLTPCQDQTGTSARPEGSAGRPAGRR